MSNILDLYEKSIFKNVGKQLDSGDTIEERFEKNEKKYEVKTVNTFIDKTLIRNPQSKYLGNTVTINGFVKNMEGEYQSNFNENYTLYKIGDVDINSVQVGNFVSEKGESVPGISELENKNVESEYDRFNYNKTPIEEPFVTVRPGGFLNIDSSAGNEPTGLKYAKSIIGGTVDLTSAALKDTYRIGKFLISPRGVGFVFRSGLLQLLNPTLETKLYNPVSAFRIPFLHFQRHLSTSSTFNVLLPGLKSLASETYEESLRKLPVSRVSWKDNEQGSRAIYQSPLTENDVTEKPGFKYYDMGKSYITDESLLKIDPNRYYLPIHADTSGIPAIGRMSTFEEAKMRSSLAKLGVKYTKSTGYVPMTDQQISELMRKPSWAKILERVIGIESTAALVKLISFRDKVTAVKIINQYNPTFKYLNANKIYILDVSKSKIEYDITENKSPLVGLLESLFTVGDKKVKTIDPGFNFHSVDQLKEVTQVSQDKRLEINQFSGNEKSKLFNYLQSYGEIRKIQSNKETGDLSLTSPTNEKEDSGYERDEEIYDNSLIKKYGFSDSGKIWSTKLDFKGDPLVLQESGEKPKVPDLIPFNILHINTNKWVHFRGTISGLTISTTAEWNSRKYIGRAQKVYTYSGADKKINFNFMIYPNSIIELAPMWRKINFLEGLLWPRYINIENNGEYMEAPFIKLTLGDLFKKVPSIIDSISITPSDDVYWETLSGKLKYEDRLISVGKLPRFIVINCSITIIGHDLYDSNSNFYDADLFSEEPSETGIERANS